MNQTTTAIYENGLLRLVSPLDLPEHSEVEITIHIGEQKLADKVGQALRSANLSVPAEIKKSEITDERRAELAEIFAGEKSLGELIDEDRERL